MYTYALLDINNICTGFVEISKRIIRDGYLPIARRDVNLIGKIWDAENEQWFDGKTTQLDTIEANTTYLVMLSE